jgi:deoxyribose-phosphate aldolase
MLSKKDIVQMIDHSLLKPNATYADIEKACEECREYNFKTLTLNSANVAMGADLLKGTDIGISACIGFPLGAMSTEAKVFETKDVIKNGATEIDMVMNIGAFLSKDYQKVKDDINAVVKAANGNCVKVILENHYLTKEEIAKACQLCEEAGAHFVKTSSGFAPSGAKLDDVIVMRKSVSNNVEVKVAGGVSSFEAFMQFYNAGATRFGTSKSLKIMNEYDEKMGEVIY